MWKYFTFKDGYKSSLKQWNEQKNLSFHCGVFHNALPLLKSFPSVNPFIIHKATQNCLCFGVLFKGPHNWIHNITHNSWQNYFHFSVNLEKCYLGNFEKQPSEKQEFASAQEFGILYELFLTNVWQTNIYMWGLGGVMKGKQLS